MKKTFLSLGMVSMGLVVFVTGCGTTQTENAGLQARKDLNDFIVGARAAENIKKTGDKGIDAVADSSTIIYKRIGGSMREYIEKTRGTQVVIDMCYYLTDHSNESESKYISAAQEMITGQHSVLTDIEKKEWTAEKLYKAAKEKNALQAYIAYETGLKKAEDKAAYMNAHKGDENVQKQLDEGKAIFQATLAKEDWSAKIAEMNKLLSDSTKIAQNIAVLLQETTKKLMDKTQESTALASSPAMQGFIKETTPLIAKKTFANAERKKEIDAEIDLIAKKAEYKPAMDKKAQLATEMEKLKDDCSVLSDGIGTQTKFTGKAIPWLIEEYTNMMSIKE